jgi:hypothetical protein
MFILEWIFYNFVMIFIIVAIITLCVLGFRIWKRRKKHGLGPRIVSFFYIDGLNLKSIGNILCIIGIIIAIFGLFNTWYVVSYDFSSNGDLAEYETSGMTDVMKIDGIDGIEITVPGGNGPVPVGTASLPFSFFIAIGLIFLIIAVIGISHSAKLGRKYLWRGIKLLIPVVLIVIVMMMLSSIIPADAIPVDPGETDVTEILNSISGSPSGGEQTFIIKAYEGQDYPLKLKWGFGLGAILLLFSAIILLVAGALEISANTQLFTPKTPAEPAKKPKKGKQPPEEPKESPKPKEASKKKAATDVCPECGGKLRKNAKFCTKCGKKL